MSSILHYNNFLTVLFTTLRENYLLLNELYLALYEFYFLFHGKTTQYFDVIYNRVIALFLLFQHWYNCTIILLGMTRLFTALCPCPSIKNILRHTMTGLFTVS